ELQEKGGEFGATTGRKRRCGWLDGVVAADAVRLNGLTGLALTKLDVLSGQPVLKMATEYELGGKRQSVMPSNINQAAAVKPVYEEFAGWSEDITGVRDFADLPVKTREYVKRIEEFTGVEAVIVSVGPDRDETILLKNPFEK
ncbi:MAG: adenylosuccinate synthetase, partial [Rhodoferax sp.]|nr:adenylosuccinate synthetase [Rhodoferax sp.]